MALEGRWNTSRLHVVYISRFVLLLNTTQVSLWLWKQLGLSVASKPNYWKFVGAKKCWVPLTPLQLPSCEAKERRLVDAASRFPWELIWKRSNICVSLLSCLQVRTSIKNMLFKSHNMHVGFSCTDASLSMCCIIYARLNEIKIQSSRIQILSIFPLCSRD